MCSLVEISPKVGHVRLRKFRLREERRHSVSWFIFHYSIKATEWAWSKSVGYYPRYPWTMTVWDIAENGFLMTLASCVWRTKVWGKREIKSSYGWGQHPAWPSHLQQEQWCIFWRDFSLIQRWHGKNLGSKWAEPLVGLRSGFACHGGQGDSSVRLLVSSFKEIKVMISETTAGLREAGCSIPITQVISQLMTHEAPWRALWT